MFKVVPQQRTQHAGMLHILAYIVQVLAILAPAGGASYDARRFLKPRPI